jgi:hypothetical protein
MLVLKIKLYDYLSSATLLQKFEIKIMDKCRLKFAFWYHRSESLHYLHKELSSRLPLSSSFFHFVSFSVFRSSGFKRT